MFAKRAFDLLRRWTSKQDVAEQIDVSPTIDEALAHTIEPIGERLEPPTTVWLLDRERAEKQERDSRMITVWIGDSSFQALVV